MLTALLLSMTLAAPGDAIYIVNADAVVLTQPQKLELASALASTFPGILPASMDKYACFSQPPALEDRTAVNLQTLAASLPFPCHAIDGNPSTTDEAALDYELESDGACRIVDPPDGSSSYLLCENKAMDSDAKTLNSAFTQSVFGKTLALVWDFVCVRGQDDQTVVSCLPRFVKIAPPDVWRADRKTKMPNGKRKVAGTIGKVEP